MLEAQRIWVRRAGLHRRGIWRALPRRLVRGETDLGSVAAQSRRVAGALTLLVTVGIVAGCFGAPAGVDCSAYVACTPDDACGECLDVPGCGPLRVSRAEACEQSCPLALECSITSACPAGVRCAGLVPGRVPAGDDREDLNRRGAQSAKPEN
jgi:hypothetical protein